MSDTFKPSLGNLLQVLAPPLIWFLHLTTVYAAEALICIGPAAAAATMMALDNCSRHCRSPNCPPPDSMDGPS